MDEISTPDSMGINAENPPAKHEGEEVHPVVWTPEDASRFLSAAIHEAQKPLADALKQRPATTPVLVLITAILVIAALAVGWILSSQLSKSEANTETARAARDSALAQQYESQSKADALEARLTIVKEEQERLSQEYIEESESLRGQVEGKRDSEEELRKAQSELVRYRRQNELLKTQISGLEMEKQALSRQLEAVRAMAIDEGPDGYFMNGDAATSDPASGEAPVPDGEEQRTPTVASPEATTSSAEPPPEEAPELDAGISASPAPAIEADFREAAASKTPESPVTISDSQIASPADGTVTVEASSENEEKGTGTLTPGINGENPSTLYESNAMMDETAVNEAASGPVQITSAGAPIPGPETGGEEGTRETVEAPVQTESNIAQAAASETIAPSESGETAKPEEEAAEQPQADAGPPQIGNHDDAKAVQKPEQPRAQP